MYGNESTNFLHKGFPNSLIAHNYKYYDAVPVEDGMLHESKNKLFTGNLTDFEFIVPPTNMALAIKGLTITGDGNTGKVYLKRSSDGSVIFPAYFTAQVKGSPSSALNLVLNDNEKVLITATDRETAETFIGISYIIFDRKVE